MKYFILAVVFGNLMGACTTKMHSTKDATGDSLSQMNGGPQGSPVISASPTPLPTVAPLPGE